MPAAAPDKDSRCPFCHEVVHEDLVIHGGQCPQCFGDIPGEEAPTDPGEHKQKEHEIELKKEARKVERGNMLPRVVGLGLLLGAALMVVVGVYAASLPPPQMPRLRITDDDIVYGIEAVATVTPAVTAGTAGGIRDPRSAGSKAPPTIGLPADGGRLIGGGTVDLSGAQPAIGPDGVAGPRKVDLGLNPGTVGLSTSVGGSAGGDLALDVTLGGPERRVVKGATLNDDDQIVEMAKRVVKTNQPGLRTCYERSLKRDPNLAGVWTLSFTVTTGGEVKKPTVKGGAVQDADLETCIAQKVQTWAFQPIKAELPIEKALTFRPN